MISVNAFSKTYGNFRAVDNLSFDVEPGQILGLLGRNGAGKSTTIRALAGITKPSTGTLKLGDHKIDAAPVAAKRLLGYIPDDPVLFEDLTVWEHLQFTARLYDVQDFETPARVLLDEFDLTSKENAPAAALSRGMRQKVSVACAYLHDPSVLLFDEPMTGLDPQGIRTLERSIVSRAEAGAAVIVSSHMLSLVENLCTHLLVLHEGDKRWAGSMAQMQSASDASRAKLEALFFSLTQSE